MEKLKQKLHSTLYLDAWQRWEYKHTTKLLVTLAIFIVLLDTTIMAAGFDLISKLGYVGVFISGVLFVSLFTAVPAVILLLSFEELNPFAVALVAGIGAMLGDYLILKFAEEKVAYELKPLAYKFGVPQAIAYLQGRKSTLCLVRIIGAFMIASPLPDELAIGLLGIGKLNRVSFLLICGVLNVLGILLLVLSVRSF